MTTEPAKTPGTRDLFDRIDAHVGSLLDAHAVLDLVIAHLEDAEPRDAKAVSALHVISEKLMAATRGIEDILGDERRAGRHRGGLAIDPNAGDCGLAPRREG